MNLLLLLNVFATLYMTGVIWFVQVVHYPLFGRVGTSGFADYEAAHTMRTGYVVAPPMLLELVTTCLLTVRPLMGIEQWERWLGLGLLGVVWFSTFCLQVPRHAVLGSGFDPAAHRFLVLSNWLRTFAWTARALLVLYMLSQRMNPL